MRKIKELYVGLLIFSVLSLVAVGSHAQIDKEYKLGSGDVIRILVYGEDDLTTEAQLTDTGKISFPLLGELQVKGLSSSQLRDRIKRDLLDGYLVDPKVTVLVLKYRPFYINGAVENPGVFDFQPGLTVRKAISLAQGYANRDSRRNITIIADSDPRNLQRRATLDTPIKPGDIINVQ